MELPLAQSSPPGKEEQGRSPREGKRFKKRRKEMNLRP
jgi:hypothetical protein